MASGYTAAMSMRFFLAASLVVLGCGPQSSRVVMNAENNSGQSGFAQLTALSRTSTRIELDLAASNDPAPQQAHVHEGRCGELGPIRVNLMPLTPASGRAGRLTSTSTADLGLEELTAGTFVINVHDSRDFSLYVSCGALE